MPRMLVACAALAAALLLHGAPLLADPVPGVISGAEAVNVRRGPGVDSAAFIALHRGDPVRVEEQSGQWALVLLESGERGYINAAYIALSPGSTIPAAMATPDETAELPPTPDPTATIAAEAAPPAIDRELAELRERLASLEATLEQPGSDGTPAAALAVGSEAEPPPLAPLIEPPATLDVGPSLALAGVGFVVGFLFGTLYGQRQERNSRTRVRF